VPAGTGKILLLGPDEPGFWGMFTESPEYRDGRADPMDRWSRRVIGELAKAWGGVALLPSDGPPYLPFERWATDSGVAWRSPVGPLVHRRAGLFISFRGAVALPHVTESPCLSEAPCTTCAGQPCTTACPVDALSPSGPYDTEACGAYLHSDAGRECLENGCLVRRACPVVEDFERLPAQSAFHMAAFLKGLSE
jgi:hypothetical protein